jgi:hypothetical protein
VKGIQLLDVMNDLGSEGWELVGEEVTESAVGKRYGWSEAGFPIIRTRTFKRRIETTPA